MFGDLPPSQSSDFPSSGGRDARCDFPGMNYLPDHRLITWHPTGVLDDALADQIVTFIEREEETATRPFDRFTDLEGLLEIRLKVGHAFQIAERRRGVTAGRTPVKSAIVSSKIIGFGIARMYETLMDGATIQVRAFKSRAEAAQWLQVPEEILQPPKTTV